MFVRNSEKKNYTCDLYFAKPYIFKYKDAAKKSDTYIRFGKKRN